MGDAPSRRPEENDPCPCCSRSSTAGCRARTSPSATASASCGVTTSQIKEAVRRAINGRSIPDIEQGEDVILPVKDVTEPKFGHAHGGNRENVNPGNKEYVKGDQIERPQGGGGGGGGQAGNSDEGEDDFVFHLSRKNS